MKFKLIQSSHQGDSRSVSFVKLGIRTSDTKRNSQKTKSKTIQLTGVVASVSCMRCGICLKTGGVSCSLITVMISSFITILRVSNVSFVQAFCRQRKDWLAKNLWRSSGRWSSWKDAHCEMFYLRTTSHQLNQLSGWRCQWHVSDMSTEFFTKFCWVTHQGVNL